MRKKRKLSQLRLAHKMDWESTGFIGEIESRNPDSDKVYNCEHLNKLAQVLGCSPREFWPDLPLNDYSPVRGKNYKEEI